MAWSIGIDFKKRLTDLNALIAIVHMWRVSRVLTRWTKLHKMKKIYTSTKSVRHLRSPASRVIVFGVGMTKENPVNLSFESK